VSDLLKEMNLYLPKLQKFRKSNPREIINFLGEKEKPKKKKEEGKREIES
jgi:hypothetical protein